ncbi:MAG: bifunctional methylenetetrahydrofolate dehydrogenase/methenyltetrahydrofolate cyclohydrolase, partial [Halioglobus sp.]|nr:bifunctional methylenetetrahydrofolate dehydrogenase/methenyltetrahydrofolate cyclohydrolase [Halioglobus sp.]
MNTTAIRIDGKAMAAEITDTVRLETDTLKRERGISPGLAVVIVGQDPASQVYV